MFPFPFIYFHKVWSSLLKQTNKNQPWAQQQQIIEVSVIFKNIML